MKNRHCCLKKLSTPSPFKLIFDPDSRCFFDLKPHCQQILSFQPTWKNWGEHFLKASSIVKGFIDVCVCRYFVNDKDQIRQIDAPEKRFHYFISKNERYVQMHREAMNGDAP